MNPLELKSSVDSVCDGFHNLSSFGASTYAIPSKHASPPQTRSVEALSVVSHAPVTPPLNILQKAQPFPKLY